MDKCAITTVIRRIESMDGNRLWMSEGNPTAVAAPHVEELTADVVLDLLKEK